MLSSGELAQIIKIYYVLYDNASIFLARKKTKFETSIDNIKMVRRLE